jgi:hypothetical protein
LYWDHVRPFTPPEDRAVVTRDCSTRFPPSEKNRPEIDVKDYEHAPWNRDEKKRKSHVYYRVPVLKPSKYRAGGLDASWECHKVESTNPEQISELLQATRKQWDDHLAKLDSAADRLTASLDIVWGDSFSGGSPLLFPGDGGIDAILTYHLRADPRAIGSTKLTTAVEGEATKTILGHFISRFLEALHEDCGQEIRSCQTDTVGNILDKLFEHGADAKAFEVPVRELTGGTISTFRHFYFSELWEGSLLENMKAYAEEAMRSKVTVDDDDYYEYSPKWEMYYGELGRIAGGLEWVVGEVEKISKKAKGEKVGEENERAWVKVGKKLGYGFRAL